MSQLVRIVRDYHWPDLLRQTPNHDGVWNGWTFTTEEIEECDYLVALNYPDAEVSVRCPPSNVWAILQEPPVTVWRDYNKIYRREKAYARVFTTHPDLGGKRFTPSQPALPWHVNRDYDFLSSVPCPEKTKSLSWITSNVTALEGHRSRMSFLDRIRNEVDFDLFGRGFYPIDDKWDGLAPYRYSLVVENYRNPYYWSEKISDCFLAWTVPIYCGCTKITDYFPSDSLIEIDIEGEDVVDRLRSILKDDSWEKRVAAIREARELVLNKHQLFPFLSEKLAAHEKQVHATEAPARIVLRPPKEAPSLRDRILRAAKRRLPWRCYRLLRDILTKRS